MKINSKVETVNTGKRGRIIGSRRVDGYVKWQVESNDEGFVSWYWNDQLKEI